MAINPRTRAALPSAEDNFYGDPQDEPVQRVPPTAGQDGGGQGGADGDPDPADPADDLGGEQIPGVGEGDPEDLDPDDTDFFVEPARRGEHRQQSLANENRELRRRLDELRGVDRPAAPAATQPRGETDLEFEARIQLLPFEERMEARYKRDRQTQRDELQRGRLENALAADKAAFDAKALSDKRYQRWQPRVEAEAQRRLAIGQIVGREDLLKWMIGDRLVNGDEEPIKRERARAADRVARATTRPARSGSDVGRPSRRGTETEAQARARRLEGQQI